MSLLRYPVPRPRGPAARHSRIITPAAVDGAAAADLGAPTAASVSAATTLVTADTGLGNLTAASISAATTLVTAPTGIGSPSAASVSAASVLVTAPALLSPTASSVSSTSNLLFAPGPASLGTPTAASGSSATGLISTQTFLTAAASGASAASGSITVPGTVPPSGQIATFSGMKFKHQVLFSLEAAQQNFEQIQQAALYSGNGAPTFTPTGPKGFFLRYDTPTIANQRLYIWNGTSWTGIL